MTLTIGGLFSGIGGIELGLERAGMRVLWHCEADEFCQHILSERWPAVPCFPDVRDLVADPGRERVEHQRGHRQLVGAPGTGASEGAQRQRLRDAAGSGGETGRVPVQVPYVDVLCGGFPCQDISLAGRGAGIEGSRSGLWVEYARLIGELRPRYVVIENVAALLARGLDRVLADLAALGFDAEWDCLPASAVGAPHRRDRIWIVAYPQRDDGGQGWPGRPDPGRQGQREPVGALQVVADADHARLEGHRGPVVRPGERPLGQARADERGFPGHANHWAVEPDVGRVAHGVPARVDRLRALGNAVVPQVAEWVGRRIVAWERQEGRV